MSVLRVPEQKKSNQKFEVYPVTGDSLIHVTLHQTYLFLLEKKQQCAYIGKDQTSWPIKHSGNQGLRFFQIQ